MADGESREPRELRRVCVFCGSSSGGSPRYAEAARALGACMAARGIGLVYGGGRNGLMGTVADAVLAGGAEVIGVIPEAMLPHEVAHEGLTELVVVDGMFARKQRMMDDADAFISLPGGIGTLDELFEVMTWNQLGYLSKPNGLLDVDGFWSPLTALLDATVQGGFLKAAHRDRLVRGEDPEDLLDQLATWVPGPLDKLRG